MRTFAFASLTALLAVANAVPQPPIQSRQTSCARCDEVAHGFASLNGGTTGGKGGTVVTVSTHADLKKYAAASGKYIIRVSGTITSDPKGYEIPIANDKTIIGVGNSAKLIGGGFTVKGTKNIILRNLQISDTYIDGDWDGKLEDWDGIQIDTGFNVWIDHVFFTRMADGLIDLRKDSNYITVSNCKFADHNKAFGIGWTENVVTQATINDNFFLNTQQRNPSADNLKYCHMYNNYHRNLTAYGNYARGNTQLLVENSYFENSKNPVQADTATAKVKGNSLVFKSCSGSQVADLKGSEVFKANSFYSYSLKDPNSLPSVIPGSVGPQANIGG